MRTWLGAALLGLGLLAMGCGDEDAEPEAALEDDLGEGATAAVVGKADGFSGPVIYSSAMTVGPLLYRNFEGEGEAERSVSEVADVFAKRIAPAGGDAQPWRYLRKMSALGYYGPVGPYGPLGILGPTGGSPWNPELYVTGDYRWSDWSQELAEDGDGPLGPDGPLGALGPLSTDTWALADAKGIGTDFVSHLRPGGVFALLGPVGVSGALGPLGPLGPVGAHGHLRSDGGPYLPEGDACLNAPEAFKEPPCRVVEVVYDDVGTTRVYELVERYDEAFAAQMEDNDTSFMVTGEIEAPGKDADVYAFTSARDQWVSILVVPEYAKYPFVQAMGVLGQSATGDYQVPQGVYVPHIFSGVPVWQSYDHQAAFDDFDVEVELERDGKGLGAIVSQSADVVDWVHVRVPAGTTFKTTVSLYRSWGVNVFSDPLWGLTARPVSPQYRLIVVGSTEYGQGQVTFSGPYLKAL